MKTSDYLLYAWLICPVVYWVVVRRWSTAPKLGCFTYILGYFLLLVTVGVVDSELWHEMMSYDLDGDGSVTGIEETPQAIAAEREWSNDIGRSLAAVTGILYVLIWYSLVILILWTIESIAKWILTTRGRKGTADAG